MTPLMSRGDGDGQETRGLANLGTPIGDRPIRLSDYLSAAQITAVRSGQPVAGLAETIEDVCNRAGAQGFAVSLMPGSYDLRRVIRLHPRCWLVAETPGSSPRATYNSGFQRDVGVVLVKNHNDPAILYVEGNDDYATCGGIIGLSLSGNPASATSKEGDGLVINRVGGYRIEGMKLYSIPRDGIVLGTSQNDATGQIIMNDIYVNNPGRYAIRNRSKWLKAAQIATDGGLCGYFADSAPNADLTQFHFEGAADTAIILSGHNGNSRFRGGFIGMTNRSAKAGVRLAAAPGNADITFRDIQLVGYPDLPVAFDIGESAWRTRILDCEITAAAIGVRDLATGTAIAATFLQNALPIEAHGQSSDYRGSTFVDTRGPWGIEHRRGGGGIWTDIRTDRPFRSTAPGAPGTFGTNRVADNPGFRTAFRAWVPAGPSPLRVRHDVAVGPVIALVTEMGARADAPAYTVQTDAEAVTIRWPGGGLRSFVIDARAPCETPVS